MPGTKLMPLYLATSVKQLEEQANASLSNVARYNVDNLCKSVQKVYNQAEEFRKEGDEEKSYLLFLRYWELIQKIINAKEYKTDRKFYESMIGGQNAKTALDHIEKLKSSLQRRYEIMSEERQRKKEEEEELSKNLQKIPEKEKDAGEISNQSNKYKEQISEISSNITENNEVTISSKQLYNLMNDNVKKVLIIDVRSQQEFNDSHIRHSTCFNIDENVIEPGLTGPAIEKKLSLEILPYWKDRVKADYIILYDWLGNDRNKKMSTLKIAMTKWDNRVTLKQQPLYLDGGFDTWQLHYPMVTSKRLPVDVPEYVRPTENELNINDFDYPDLEDYSPENKSSGSVKSNSNTSLQKQPTIDRAYKPSVIRFPSSPIITNLDQSLMPNGTSNSDKPQINRALKPKESDFSTNLINTPEEMKKLLAKQEKVASESLSIEKERFEKEESLKMLQLKREKQAEESMRAQLQELEEELLEKIEKLELEKKKKGEEEKKMKDDIAKSKQLIETLTKQRHADLKTFEADKADIEKKCTERLQLERQTERLRQERKNKEKDVKKPNVGNKTDINTIVARTESPKIQMDHAVPKTESKIVQPAGDSYYTKLNDHPGERSASGNSLQLSKPSLSRSHSSPNIAQMISNEDEIIRTQTPHFDRGIKPFTKTDRKIPTIAQQPEDYNAARMRNLMPVYGNQGRALTGLKNLGNTCFMNSIIQCLAQTAALARYFIQGLYRNDINRTNPLGTGGELAEEFAVVIRALWAGQYRSIAPRDFKNTVSKYQPIFEGYEQQDSQEFLLFLMDGLHEDLKEVQNKTNEPKSCDNENLPDAKAAAQAWEMHLQRNQSLIVKLFQGQLKSTVKCLHCKKQSVSFDPFQFLSLPIPSGSSSRFTLKDCLELYLKEEKMAGADKWNCPKCKERREAVKKCDIWKLPPVLLIHLKRFSFEGMWRRKLQTQIDFPLQGLDFRSYVKDTTARYLCYNLYAVSNHYGTMEGGHYTAYCKNSENQKWYKFDDHEVYEMGSSEVKSPAAYILFYTADNFRAGPLNE